MARHLSGSSLRLLAGAMALAFTRQLAAQEPPPRVIISGSGNGAAFATMMTSPISDDVIRSLIQAHLPDELQQTDPQHIALVVDANDQYVSSKVTKATVVTGEGAGIHFVYGDTAGANVGPIVIRRTSSGDSTRAAGTAFSIMTSRSDEPSSGVFGTGYSMTDIASLGIRRFTAGQLGNAAIIVTVVKLK
jgi:hypothetical protein